MPAVPVASRSPRPQSRITGETRALILVIGFCALAAGLAAAGPLAGLFSHRSIDYGEGWNAYWATAAMQGPGHLYSSAHGLVASNYPPLSFYLCGLLGKLIGDNIFAGRLIATAAMGSVAILIALIVRRCGGTLAWAIAAAALFLSYDILYFSQFVGVNNPQWLGQAIMLAGVLHLLGAEPLPRSRIVLAAGIMILAGLVKHNQFALPLAVTIWLAWQEPRSLVTWLTAAFAWGVLACLALLAIFGPAIFVELVAFKRTTNIANFVEGLRKIGCLGVFLIVALAALPARIKDRRWSLFAIYALLGLVLGALQRLGSGVYINAHFDALISLVLLASLSLAVPTSGRGAIQGPMRAILPLLLLVPIALVAHSHIKRSFREVRHMTETEHQWDSMIADVRAARGTVLCEVPSVCYWAGKPFTLDFFAYGQKLRTGTSAEPLKRFIEDRRASLLILDSGYDRQSGEGRLPAPFPTLMRDRYKLVRIVSDSIEERSPGA